MAEEPTEKKVPVKTYLCMASLVALAVVVVILVFGRSAKSEFGESPSARTAER